MIDHDTKDLLVRIAGALERMAPEPAPEISITEADAFVWHAGGQGLEPVPNVKRVDIALLQGISRQQDQLIDNTKRFTNGFPANNALLWGARGTGKSSLVKAVHALINKENPGSLALIEIHREDIPTLPTLLTKLRSEERRCLIFCDDLSFDGEDEAYKSLKAVL